MFARVATFEGVDVAAVQQTLGQVRDRIRSIVEGMPGWQGVLQLADRESGKVLTISLFDTEENMRAAEQTFEDIPRQVPEVRQMAGGRASVERFEVTTGIVRGQDL